MKTKVFVQYFGHQVADEELIQKAKEYWKQAGNKIKDIKTLDLYVKPEDFSVYYSINQDEQKGRIEF